MECVFQGSARAVHLRGQGAAMFVLKTAVSAGAAERVALHTAEVGGVPPIVVLVAPAELDPIAPDVNGGAFDATYTFDAAGPERPAAITIVVSEGGDPVGAFLGKLAGAPACEKAYCDVKWLAGKAKKLVVTPAWARVAELAGRGERMALTDSFPYEKSGFTRAASAQLTELALTAASGELKCDGAVQQLEAASVVWQPDRTDTVKIPDGLTLSPAGLGVRIESGARPVTVTGGTKAATATGTATAATPTAGPLDSGAGSSTPKAGSASSPWWPPSLGLIIGIAAAVVLAMGLWMALRRRARPRSRPAPPLSAPAQEPAKPGPPVDVFYSYAREDLALRDELAKHLTLLEKRGLFRGFHDRMIAPGSDWKGQLDRALGEARIILLLVSPDFFASDYCYDTEVRRAMERHEAGEACVIPVLLRPYAWKQAPFGKLSALPKDGRSVTEWPDRDAAFRDIALGIEEALALLPPRQP
jgi:hypothetical protein